MTLNHSIDLYSLYVELFFNFLSFFSCCDEYSLSLAIIVSSLFSFTVKTYFKPKSMLITIFILRSFFNPKVKICSNAVSLYTVFIIQLSNEVNFISCMNCSLHLLRRKICCLNILSAHISKFADIHTS